MTEQTTIELSKGKLIFLLIGSSAFAILGVWISVAKVDSRVLILVFRSLAVVHGLGLVAVVFFGLCSALYFWKLFDKEPGLVLNADGLIDNSSGTPAGRVPWSDIVAFEVMQVCWQKPLVVKLVDPTRYAEMGSPPMRAIRRMNVKLCGSPIAISSNALRIDFSELVGECNAWLEKYRTFESSRQIDSF